MALALRCVLAALLLGTVADKVQVASVDNSDTRAVVVQGLLRQGLSVAPSPRDADFPDTAYLAAPGCDRPLQVMPLSLSLQEAPLREAVTVTDYRRRYIYLGQTWPAPDRIGLRLAWLQHKVRSVLGLGRHSALPKTVLLVAEPPECRIAENIDWSALWEPGANRQARSRS